MREKRELKQRRLNDVMEVLNMIHQRKQERVQGKMEQVYQK